MKTESAQQESSNQRRFAVCLVADGKALLSFNFYSLFWFVHIKQALLLC